MSEIKEPSLSHRIIAIIGGTASFIVTVWIFFTLFSPVAESNVSVVMSVISGVMVGWIVLSLSGVLKQFSLKSPFFEMTANVEKKVDEIKTETKDLKNDVSKINQRIDTVITNQMTANQSQSINIVNGIEEEKRSIEKQIDEATKSYVKSGQLPVFEETPIPKVIQTQVDKLIEREKELENLLKRFSKFGHMDIESVIKKANYFYTKKDYKKASKLYEQILEEDEDNLDALFNLALCFSNLDQHEDAIDTYKKRLQINSDDNTVFSNLSHNYMKIGEYKTALDYANKAITIAPDDGNGWYNVACSQSLLNNKNEALKALKKAINLDSIFKTKAKNDSDFDFIKNEPEFKKLMES